MPDEPKPISYEEIREKAEEVKRDSKVERTRYKVEETPEGRAKLSKI